MAADLRSFAPLSFQRYAPGDCDVCFDIQYCGMCHTDVHFVKNELGGAQYPMIPGHELIGRVTAVGSQVTKLAVGDNVGVGCMVDSCLQCDDCKQGYEQYCSGGGSTGTYGGVAAHGRCGEKGRRTMGGYSNKMVVHEHFAVKVPKDVDLAVCAPLLCAGITMYEPLCEHGCKEGGKRVGVAGLGGLGMMGIKLAAAMGCEVTAISTSPQKEQAAKAMGAARFIDSRDEAALAAAAGSLDVILDTISAPHGYMPFIHMLATHGTLVMLGLGLAPQPLVCLPFLVAHKSLTASRWCAKASLIGGLPRTQEMMDFCCEKQVFPEVEVIGPERVAECLEKLDRGNDSIKRFVLDCSKL
ncbi:unnamed protein product [Polarella glacialis]|nr:unnamed protein product [Polarella glacialis]